MIASFGTDSMGPRSTTISMTYNAEFARPVAASVASTAAPPPGRGVTLVTNAWYMEDFELGGNARTRWPIFTSAASRAVSVAVRILLVWSIVPAARIQLW